MNLKEKIKAIADSTTSEQVKAACQKYLTESANADIASGESLTEALFQELQSVNEKDSLLSELLNEKFNHFESKRKIEARISKGTAQKLMESWNPSKSQTSKAAGTFKNDIKDKEAKNEANSQKTLVESLTILAESDPSAGKMLAGIKTDDYGVAAAIKIIKESKVSSHYQLKYVLQRFEDALASGVSEARIVKDFVSNMSTFTWDNTVNEAYSIVKTNVDKRAVDLEVHNAIIDIKESDKKRFFTEIVESMNNWLADEKRNIPTLVNSLKAWHFNGRIKSLVNTIGILENSVGTKFNVVTNHSNCTVAKVYSPVKLVNEGSIFKAGTHFYISTKEGMSKLTTDQINALPAEFHTLCEAFFNPAVNTNDEGIHVRFGKVKVTINESGTFINGKAIEKEKLGQALLVQGQQTLFANPSDLINVAVRLQESYADIMEVDYGKAIISNLYEGVGIHIFRKDNNLYLNKYNTSMNENKFYKANAVQAVTLVKNFLGYDLAGSLVDMLDGDLKKKAVLEAEMKDVLSNIQILESEIGKIEGAISENPDFADIEDIAQAKTMLEDELNILKSDWQKKNEEIKKFENAEEGDLPCEICGMEPCECPPTDDKEDGSDKGPDAPEDGAAPAADDKEPEIPAADDKGAAPADAIDPTDDKEPDNVVPPADDTTGVQSSGLAGAEGTQDQAAAIAGNDHIDANAAGAAETGTQVVDNGNQGAEGAQTQTIEIPGGADVTKVPTTSDNAELVVADVAAEPIVAAVVTIDPEKSADEPEAATPVDGAAPAADDKEPETPATDDIVADDKGAAPEEDKEEDKKKITEAIDAKSQVKLKGSDKQGVVTSGSTAEGKFVVLWDGGETGEYSLDQLEELSAKIEDNAAKNQEEGEEATKQITEDDKSGVEGEGKDDLKNIEVWTKAKLSIDFGPFKEGETVDVDAAQIISSGDDDAIKIKDPKDEIGSIPKKYLKIEDGGDNTTVEVGGRIENVVKNLQEIETLLQDNDKIDTAEIKDALGKIKAFSAALKNGKEDKGGE